MNDEHVLRIAGGLLATTPTAIGSALVAAFPTAKLEVSTEVAIEGDAISIAIYPDRDAPEGGSDFLVGGNLWLGSVEALAVLEAMADALARADIAFSLESSGDESRDLENERYRLILEGRQRSNTR